MSSEDSNQPPPPEIQTVRVENLLGTFVLGTFLGSLVIFIISAVVIGLVTYFVIAPAVGTAINNIHNSSSSS